MQNRARLAAGLKIGDDWNAITIIALSQSSPLKAIAELVENSIDVYCSPVLRHPAGLIQAAHFRSAIAF